MLKETSRLSLNFMFGAWVMPAGETGKRQHRRGCCCYSVIQSCLTICDPMYCSMPGFPALTISRSLLKLMSIESVMPPNHFILCHPLLLLFSVFPSIRVFSNESVLPIRWPEYWSFNFSIGPSNEYSRLISYRIDWLVWSPCSPRNSQESSPAPQFESISSSALSLLYGPVLTSVCDYWENCSFDYTEFCGQNDVFAF